MQDNAAKLADMNGPAGRPDIEAQIAQLKTDISAVSDTLSAAAREQLGEAKDQADELAGDIQQRIRKDPISSVAVAAGVGLLLGVLISR